MSGNHKTIVRPAHVETPRNKQQTLGIKECINSKKALSKNKSTHDKVGRSTSEHKRSNKERPINSAKGKSTHDKAECAKEEQTRSMRQGAETARADAAEEEQKRRRNRVEEAHFQKCHRNL